MTIEEAIEELKYEWDYTLEGMGIKGREKEEAERNEDFRKVYQANMMAIKALEEQKTSRWIPVSERMPEEYRRVIVSDVFGIYIGEFVDSEESWGGKHFINIHGMHSKSVRAWMPLPEPYKETEDESSN